MTTKELHNGIKKAIKSNNIDDIKECIGMDLDVNICDGKFGANGGYSLLHHAIEAENEGVFFFLVKQGAILVYDNRFGITLLHLASRHNMLSIASYLIKSQMNIEALDRDGETPFLSAHSKEMIALFLKAGAEINHQDKNGYSLLHILSTKDNLEALEFLLSSGIDTSLENKTKQTAYDWAIEVQAKYDKKKIKPNLELLRRYGDFGSKNLQEEQKLFDAVKTGSLKSITSLISSGAEINHKNKHQQTLLHEALSCKQNDIAYYLIDNAININALDWSADSALHISVGNNDLQMTKYLLDHGADVNISCSNEGTPLHIAASGLYEIAKLLIAHGADVNALCPATPLHTAYMEYAENVAKLLLENGADPSIRDDNGCTPYDIRDGNV